MNARWLPAIIVAAAILIAGCPGPTPPQDVRDRTERPSESSPAATAAASQPFTIHLQGEPAAAYRTDEHGSDSLLSQLARDSLPGLQVSACLERAAALYSQATPQHDDRLPLEFAEFVLHWAGCPDATVTISTVLTDQDNPRAVLDDVNSSIADDDYTHVGVAKGLAQAPYHWRWVVFLVERLFTMRPVPASGQPGEAVPMLLRLDPELSYAWVVVTLPRGETRRYEVGLAGGQGMAGGWAVVSVPLAEEVGRQWVEIMAERGQGPEVIALFPIEVGREPSEIWVGEPRPDESWIKSAGDAEKLAATLIRRDRERFSLPVLELDPVLSEIARQHSRDMARSDYFAHVSPTTGSIVDRLHSKGYLATYAAENLARSPHIADAQDALMRSPGHRAAVLTTKATRVGVGVVIIEGSDRAYLVTQIYARPAPHR